MTLAQLLAQLGDATAYPFFGGWKSPNPANANNAASAPAAFKPKSITLADDSVVVVDPIPGETHGDDLLCRVYYRHLADDRIAVRSVDIYVTAFGTANEAARLNGPARPKVTRILTLAGVMDALGRAGIGESGEDLVKGIYIALGAAAVASPPNFYAGTFFSLLTPGTGAGVDFNSEAVVCRLDIMQTEGVLTAAQVALLKSLQLPPTSF